MRWSDLSCLEQSKLLELACQEIDQKLPPLKQGSSERDWAKIDAEVLHSLKKGF